MQSVAESATEKILVLVDELIGEGHSPTHFARQLVRFLRNVTVAKIAGKDSSLLQISSDERARVARVAELFSEEDLARHLQIMLRTHGELGYRQEQRFHLELGLLKMAHAQRLLPIEQLLSNVGDTAPQRNTPRPILAPPVAGHSFAAPDPRRAEGLPSARSNSISPFAADSARKGTPKADAAADGRAFADTSVRGSQLTGSSANAVNMGSAALAVAELSQQPELQTELSKDDELSRVEEAKTGPSAEVKTAEVKTPTKTEARRETTMEVTTERSRSDSRPEVNAESLRDVVLSALSNQIMLVSLLETAEWSLNGNSLVAKVAASNTMIEMSFTADARRIAGAAASGLAGRPMKMLVEPGGVPQSSSPPRRPANGSARSRAEQDPVVQRMQQKFKAEIRTVIDYREKG